MGRRSKRAERCERCQMHLELCLCAEIPSFVLDTHLALVLHRREVTKTTNTGRLALLSLTNSARYVHGVRDEPLDLTHLHTPERRVAVMFPCDEAELLTPEWIVRDPRPVTLVVPDGNWGQARRMARRIPGLSQAEKVILPPSLTQYKLRREVRTGGLATFEAISQAFGILESVEVQEALDKVFALMVKRTLWSREKTGSEPPSF